MDINRVDGIVLRTNESANVIKIVPSNIAEILALIYAEKHATSETTPEGLYDLYLKAKTLIIANR